ncbi:MAG: hypothetical protein C0404_09850 [Verrucomicrobia bacterium]|nr:hypothetical protein [Verrucomicrobiota bacterium]
MALNRKTRMSVVHEKLHGSSASAKKWYLKIEDGTIYGPVEAFTLCNWAAQGRVLPGNTISENMQDWLAAETLSELKLEWMASLPDGKEYGPFHMLALPQLFHNGTLPAACNLKNRVSGKQMSMADLIKSEPASEHDDAALSEEREKRWEERYRDEKKYRMLHEAELQQSMDHLRKRVDAAEDTIHSIATAARFDLSKAAADGDGGKSTHELIRDTVARLQHEADSLRIKLSEREHELAIEKADKDNVAKQLSEIDDKHHRETEQMRRQAEAAQRVQKDLIEEREKYEHFNKQARQRELELHKTVEDVRRKDDGDSQQVKKLMQEIQDMEAQRSFLQSRAREEEQKLKARVEAIEKDLSISSRELAEQKKKAQHLEKELQLREEKLRGQVAQMARQTSALTEIDKLKRELDAQKSAYSEVKRIAAEKEATLSREAQLARASSSSAEGILAALRQEYETQKQQARQRENDLQQRLNQTQKQIDAGSTEVVRLRTEITSQKERYEAMLRHEKERQESFKHKIVDMEKDLRQKAHQLAEASEKIEEEKTLLVGTRTTESKKENELRQQISQLLGRMEEAKSEVEDERIKYRKLEQETSGIIAELRQTAAAQEQKHLELSKALESAAREVENTRIRMGELQGNNTRVVSELNTMLKDARDAAEAATQKLAAQEAKFHAFRDESQARERTLAKKNDELVVRHADSDQTVRNLRKDLDDSIARESDLAKMNEELAAGAADTEHVADDLRRELAKQKELSAAAGQRAQDAEKQLSSVTAELARLKDHAERPRQEAARLGDEIEKLGSDNEALVRHLSELEADNARIKGDKDRLQEDWEKDRAALEAAVAAASARQLESSGAGPVAAPQAFESMATARHRGISLLRIGATVCLVIASSAIAFFMGMRMTMDIAQDEKDIQLPNMLQPLRKPDNLLPPPLPDDERPVTSPVAAPSPEPGGQERKSPPPKKKIAWPHIDVPGTRVIYAENACTIIFDAGLFVSMTNVAPETVSFLGLVAGQIRTRLDEIVVEIEGHCDATPVSSKAIVSDNLALGKARAEVVAAILRDRFNIPADSLRTTSLGEKDPPFPGDDDASRRKNRTAVLKLVPK